MSLKSIERNLKKFKPDATIVATPDHTHYNICRDVILSNSSLLVVKPLSDKVSEVKNLIKIIKDKKKIYQVGF